MAQTSASVAFIAAAANRNSHAADIGTSSTIAFGSQRFIALWDTKGSDSKGVYETLSGHEGEVTCVRCPDEDSIVSGDNRGHLRIWRKKENQWKAVVAFKAHEKGISALAALAAFGELIVTGASDGKLLFWTRSSGDHRPPALDQTLDLNGRFPLDVQLAILPGTSSDCGLIMAVASTDKLVRIYTRSQGAFTSSLSLEGHDDWVRCLAFNSSSADSLTLASGSQDGYIRLWLIERKPESTATNDATDDLLDAFERSLGDFGDSGEGGRKLSNRSHILGIKQQDGINHSFTITFDALLIGHESHVTSLAWMPKAAASATPSTPPTLLSTSTDASLILWSPSSIPSATGDTSTSSVWLNRQRFGDIGGVKFGGFVGGLWTGDGDDVLGWGWNGNWRRWRRSAGDGERPETWLEDTAITGHQGAVKGIAWSPNGQYLISSSLDQTTRIWGPWNRSIPSGTDAPTEVQQTWHELARPQIHGYDIISSSFLSPFRMVSVADEKVARVFDAPREFVRTLKALTVVAGGLEIDEEDNRPAGASVPPLGLSNKAAAEGDETFQNRDGMTITRPPVEGELANVTLWPEVEKLFGHGYELYALAVSPSAKLIATACKSTTAEHAVIRLHNTSDWQPVASGPLTGHNLTITRIAFSPDESMILSVSRDRTWRLFSRQDRDGDMGAYVPLASEKAHGRIIWDCAWSAEGDIFATAGRDKLVKIWGTAHEGATKRQAMTTLKAPEAVTAVDFSPVDGDGRRRLAVGLETGTVQIYSSEPMTPAAWRLDLTIEPNMSHVDQVHRLAWRPKSTPQTSHKQLAMCSEDRTLRILDVRIG